MQELDYNPSKKDLTDARIHHLLAEELKPRRVSVFKIIITPSVFVFLPGFVVHSFKLIYFRYILVEG